jgi:AbrB family looped-hinge helix DNA binding protein
MAEEPRVCTVKLMKHRRITIPKAIEEALRLKEGDVLEVSVKRVITVAEGA